MTPAIVKNMLDNLKKVVEKEGQVIILVPFLIFD